MCYQLMHYRSNAGINAKSIECVWEQYDKSGTEITSEVCNRLAQDTNHKLWELAKVICFYFVKNYSVSVQ